MNLNPLLIDALKDLEFEKATEIQQKTIPIALKKKDILAAAQSGTGKTAAFLLPILNEIHENEQGFKEKTLRALIIVPTRELANQISKVIEDFSKYIRIEKTVVYGGVSSTTQAKKIERGLDILVATPGRLQEHIRNKTVDLSSVTTLVVDEVDTMLAMGFLEDIEVIFQEANQTRQILMYSATMNQNVKKLAKEFLKDPVVIEVSPQRSSVKKIVQRVIEVDPDKKAELLSYIIGSENYSQVLVFVNTKKEADGLVEHLNLDGLPASCIHGDIRQTARAKALRKFRSGDNRVLVATDIAARGIDIQMLPLVVNFELPETVSDYTHRIGRTGRAGQSGFAITLLSVKDYKMMKEIEKELILDLGREIVDDFEPNEKKPRIFVHKRRPLSQKKGLKDKYGKPKTTKKTTQKAKQKASKKTTKRDENRSFRK
ncbi:DEAD/DEAH box helicase [Poseidonibacter ostreae]|jgi:ATP-dependent RNA helicase RhlE|uniref:DEAD/DEAH box helicase n=1 Tax=Poseidonibacter ostreae TaxID=2654171 RepID=A0A6L4WNI2_9BACT|nr:DEAD/DEAH box helicase [Poseidonibacter ostreae]KAB7884556.1 DEAD/DEAH box helicase [Poseidonibacter ostreae]KAB7886970.1 DEAD/DEAH box helicase [Poseidonibacter ostreae]KAB7887218.1 DEAD/DEAH box helicase [Poseidonibacter ostreae]MAC84723.1 RNA helicase [Arcobacter sp.]